jgi:pimeloyl-ACP methyl ester carboxylesterase
LGFLLLFGGEKTMIAQLQRWLTLGSLLIAALWAGFWWAHSPVTALAGACVLLFGHAAFLLIEFILSYHVSANDSIPRAGAARYARAWLAECHHAPRVFCWRQPFRSTSIPDRLQADDRRGAVLIHGFVCNRGFWNPWLRELEASGRAFVAVNLEPPFDSIGNYVQIIDDAIARVTAATGRPPMLICHSMGGLAARAWMRESDGARVSRIVTIATPHKGTWLARFGQTVNGREMRMGSQWLQKLGKQSSTRQAPLTCWYSDSDNIVFPPSVATWPGADNRLVSGQGHVELAFNVYVRQSTLALLDEP